MGFGYSQRGFKAFGLNLKKDNTMNPPAKAQFRHISACYLCKA